jgi:hypothetical protein
MSIDKQSISDSSGRTTTPSGQADEGRVAFTMTPDDDADSIRAGIYSATVFDAKIYEKSDGVAWLVLTLEVESGSSEPPFHIEAILCIAAPRGTTKYLQGQQGARRIRRILAGAAHVQPDQTFERYRDLEKCLIGVPVTALIKLDDDGIPQVREVRARD